MFRFTTRTEIAMMNEAKRTSTSSSSNWKLDPELSRKLTLLRLRTVFAVPRNHGASEVHRHGVGDFVSRKLGELGLVVGMQQFAPSQFHETVE